MNFGVHWRTPSRSDIPHSAGEQMKEILFRRNNELRSKPTVERGKERRSVGSSQTPKRPHPTADGACRYRLITAGSRRTAKGGLKRLNGCCALRGWPKWPTNSLADFTVANYQPFHSHLSLTITALQKFGDAQSPVRSLPSSSRSRSGTGTLSVAQGALSAGPCCRRTD